MIIKCPNCGASSSLDALVDNQDAAKALALAFSLSGIGGTVVKYLGLFRPKKSQLSFGRVATLLDEIVPMIEKQSIRRDGKTYTVPTQVWESAIHKLLQQRDLGKLSLPLKSHGYLLETVLNELSKVDVTEVAPTVGANSVGANLFVQNATEVGPTEPTPTPEPPAELLELDRLESERLAEQKRIKEQREKEAARRHLDWLRQMEAEQLARQESQYDRSDDLKTKLQGNMTSAELKEVEEELRRNSTTSAGNIAKELFNA